MVAEVPPPAARRPRVTAMIASAYVLASAIWLFPVIRTPVIADDFLNPFQQATSSGPGLWDGLRFGLEGATSGTSFRLTGNTFGAAVNSLWLAVSVRTGLGLEHLYAGLKLTVFLACAMSLTTFATTAARLAGRRLGRLPTLVTVSAILFSTLQIHAFWSNDPVVSYPLSGFGAAALGIGSMTALLRLVEKPDARRAVVAGAVAAFSFLYYELNLAAIAGAGIVVLAAVLSGRDRRLAGRLLGLTVAALAPTAMALVIGRLVTGEQAAQYSGTTTRLGREAVRTFFDGLVSCLPGSAWRLSNQLLAEGIGIEWWGLVAGGAATVAVVVGRRFTPHEVDSAVPAPAPSERIDAVLSPRVLVFSVSGALVAYWVLAIGLQALTVKVQDESLGIGYVYTASAVGNCVVALALAAGVRLLWRAPTRPLTIAAFAVLATFVVVQQSVNWRLARLMESTFIVNSRLLAAFDDDVATAQRCERLERWTQGAWPDYYEVGMIDGLDAAFRYYFDEPFCPGFVRPP